MILKNKKKKIKKKNFLDRFYKYYFFLNLIIILASSAIFFNSGLWQMLKIKIDDRLEIYGFKNYKHLPSIFSHSVKGFFANYDTIYLDLNFKQIIKLENNRKDKINNQEDFYFPYKNGVGFPFDYKWSKGEISLNENKKGEIKIRLKGSRAIHWKNEKYSSYRIKTSNDEKIYGSSIFSLQKPRARNYLHEWIFHKLCKELGLIAINYDFVKLIKNGQDKGLYVFEESFSNEVVERNNRRNGPIFSMDEQFSTNHQNSYVEVYDEKKWKDLLITKVATKKLSQIFKAENNYLQNLDVDLWAKYFAIVELTQAYHGLLAKSVKYYYNSLSGLIEPIGFDGHYFTLSKIDGSKIDKKKGRYYDLLIELSNKNDNDQKNFLNLFLRNEEFKQKYFYYLNEITDINFLDNFFSKYEKEINKNLSLIYSDYFFSDHGFFYGPGIYYFNKKEFYDRGKFIRKKIKTYKKKIKIILNNEKIIINNSNINTLATPTQLICDNKSINIKEVKKLTNFNYDISSIDNYQNCSKVIFNDFLRNKSIDVKIDTYNEQDFTVLNFYNFSNNLKDYFSFSGQNLYLKKNTIIINRDIFIPSNFTVMLKPDQEIILIDNAFIFSEANWITNNKDNSKRIKIHGYHNNKGGGIYILNNKKKSLLKNIDFYNLGSLTRNSLELAKKGHLTSNFNLLGSINFYNTSVSLINCRSFNISSEDAINIVSSQFKIENINFKNIDYDALDLDFTKGIISNSKFENIGNDAIDFSGSKVKILNVFGDDIGDKFISVGENSNVNINNITASNALIGLASKDGSIVRVNNIKFDKIVYPFSSYRKKKEYKGGILYAENFNIKNYKQKILKDEFSNIFLNNKSQKSTSKNILKVLYEE